MCPSTIKLRTTNLGLPHNFPSLQDGNVPSIIIVGAGMSAGIAKMPAEILPSCQSAEAILGITTKTDTRGPAPKGKPDNRLYDWAQEVVDQLEAKGESHPRLRLAKALGLTTDKGMLGTARIPLGRVPARHRIVARLAVEDKFEAIWTLNWDMWLEKALEAVGLKEDGPRVKGIPWPMSFSTFITLADRKKLVQYNRVKLFKPHGSIGALLKAQDSLAAGEDDKAKELSERFMIAKNDFENWIDPKLPVAETLGVYLKSVLPVRPLIIVGWSIGESYFHTFLKDDQFDQLGELKNERPDALTIIDPGYKQGHLDLASKYAMDQSSTHFQVDNGPDPYSTDELFQWIQVRYALSKIQGVVKGTATIEALIKGILLKDLKKPTSSHYTISWVDDFLPAWSRLCWRDGYVHARDINSYLIPIGADSHIPWDIKLIDRTDLMAAGKMLEALENGNKTWNFNLHPGFILDKTASKLILPVPVWDSDQRQSSIVGIQALITSLQYGRPLGYIKEVSVLPLLDTDDPPDQQRVDKWKMLVARFLNLTGFADAGNIGTFDINEL